MHAVIIHPNIAVAETYRSLLKSSLGIESQLAFTSDEVQHLVDSQKCQLVVLNFPFNHETQKIYQGISGKNCKALIIPAKEDYGRSILDIRESDKCMILPQESGSKYFCETIKTLYGIELSRDLLKQDFIAVNTQDLLNNDEYSYDYFIKLSEHKFTRLVRSYDPGARQTLCKYLDKGCFELYMGREDYFAYLDKCLHTTQERSDLFRPEGKELSKVFSSEEMQMVSHVLSNLNINPLALKKANQVLRDSVEMILKEAKLFKILQDLNSHDNYIGGHSLMLAYMTSALAYEMEWEDKEVSKLTMASLLHDIALTKPSLVELHGQVINDISSLTPEDFSEYKQHPVLAAQQVAAIAGLSPDIEKIIIQHHEKQDGEGFPKGLKYSQLTPQACLFIVAEEFVAHIYNGNLSVEHLNQLKEQFGSAYSKGNFRAVYVALCKIISNNQNLRYQAA